MADTLIALAIVIVAAVLLGRSVFRSVHRVGGSSGCADGCPLSCRCDPQDDACARRDEETPAHPPTGA